MEFHEGGPAGGAVLSGSNVPAFLTKLWTLVEDPETDTLICWSPNGTSFHVFDQGRFSKEVLPKFFKHNNMASFVRQLNMYGFRKVVHIEHGGLVKPERDDTEFQHPFFVKGQEHLLENIKRKVTNVSSVRQEEMKISPEKVSKILTDVQIMRGRQETIDSKIIAMKHENEALWREVASLRQKHVQQQKVVTKLIQFLVSLVQPNRVLGMKRKLPLMLNDSSSAHSIPKYSRQFSLEHLQASPVTPASASVFSADAPLKSGPTISDITELDTHTPLEITSDWTDAGVSSLIRVKEEPSSPEVEEAVDTSRSPTTLINSILQESERHSTHNPSTANLLPDRTSPICSSTADPLPASPVVAVGLSTTEHLSPASSNQSSPCAPAHIPAPSPSRPHQKCLSIACMEKMELSDHVETIDTDLENLQSILNAQTFSFDSSPLLEFFSSSGLSGDFDLDSLDTLLSPETPKATDNSNNSTSTGMQLVQYMVPMQTSEAVNLEEGGADLPSLLELEGESYFNTDPPVEDPTISLLPSSDLPTHTDLETDL